MGQGEGTPARARAEERPRVEKRSHDEARARAEGHARAEERSRDEAGVRAEGRAYAEGRTRAEESARSEERAYAHRRQSSSRQGAPGRRASSAQAEGEGSRRERRAQQQAASSTTSTSTAEALADAEDAFWERLRTLPRPVRVAGAVVAAALALFIIARYAMAAGLGVQEPVEEPFAGSKVSFVAVGDNLPDDFIGYYADSLAGDVDDGKYDYSPIFQHVAPYIQAADLAYIDQETHIGGNDLEPQGYPSFNTTDEMADAVVDAGFDFVASATNHSYDWGTYGAINHSLSVWTEKPVAFTGTAVTRDQYEHIATQERNGITFALLNYTYGVNGYKQSQLPPYAVNFIDESRIRSDVARAQEAADVVLVAMHWGTENLMEADDDQKRYAKLLADLNVDVVLGSHPHVIGPMEWVENSDGSGHRTLVAYSLGNFLSDHEVPYDTNILEGMLSCDFVRDEGASDVRIENVKWTPLLCLSDEARSKFAVYAVDDLTPELAKKDRVLSEKSDAAAWARETTEKTVGSQWFE